MQTMTTYRVYIVGADGHFQASEIVVAADDREAVKIAERFSDQNAVEVWHLDRRVAELPKMAARSNQSPPRSS